MIVIRAEQPGDEAQIHAAVAAAFAGLPYAGGDEPDIVDRLRTSGELVLSLVAVRNRQDIVGHVGFSPVTVDGRACGWMQMAPVSVVPEFQRRGIGSTLIARGIDELRSGNAAGIGVVGNPDYYERFGFVRANRFGPTGAEAEFFRAITFAGPPPAGDWRYASAFG